MSQLSDQVQVVEEICPALLNFRTKYDFRSVSELTNHKQTCSRRTSNTTRAKKKRQHDSDSSDDIKNNESADAHLWLMPFDVLTGTLNGEVLPHLDKA